MPEDDCLEMIDILMRDARGFQRDGYAIYSSPFARSNALLLYRARRFGFHDAHARHRPFGTPPLPYHMNILQISPWSYSFAVAVLLMTIRFE